jgi:hypothetical protein
LRYLKGIVFLLVLANVGYYLYVHGLAASAPSPAPEGAGQKPVAGTVATAQSAAGSRCVSIGPFADPSDTAHAEITLRGGGYAPRQRMADSDSVDGTMVYVPIPAAPAQAAQLRRKLKGAGISDAVDVPGPDNVPVISLGLFSDAKRAQARLALLQPLGVGVQSIEHKRSGQTYWLDVDLKPTDGALNPGDLRSDATHGPQLEVRECPAAPAEARSAASVAQ